ncbi:PREDICTED: uncharacterized protein LOC104596544 [Nelumbo nucifera]|uniref:Uncharacterized protein LOC104596544 n=2 Tax=Nelumbo nucifera TaxID=4432 RepID=A0A1U8A2Z0_NELNU|nr:PREDICTED: uncharacterized protein LOC104596544 [Nelumbo nucifera]DAD19567.1 TPA_asm: hypothetical protein HUJ06_021030 [Nelumbo nucifera]
MSMPSLDSSHLSPDNSTKARPKGSDGQGAQIPQTKTPSNHGGNKSNSLVGSPEGNCVDTPNRCIEKKKMIACLKHSEDGSLELFLLVQNDGEDTLKTNIIVPASIDIPVEQLGITQTPNQKDQNLS